MRREVDKARVNKRFVVVGLALVAAIAFALSVQGGRWWSVEGFAEIGPFGGRQRFNGDWRPTGLTWVGATDRWMRLGVATWAGGLLSTLMLVVLAGTVASKRVPRLLAKSTLVAIGTAAVAGTWFFVSYPGVEGATIDRGTLLFPVALLCGAAGAIAVVRAPAPVPAPAGTRG
ncbi:MAG: hypothetical protein KIT31_20735 [Deltaproteobacteria bacterium]|nr:hypothetical protein [Deltaproteobacteria bacterium]